MMNKQQHVIVIAEVGSVHDGSFGNALKLIETAAECGADIVKFQTHISTAETLRDAPMPPYFKGEPRYEYFERTAFTFEQWQQLKAHCDSLDVGFLSSPFSIQALDLLEKLDTQSYKVASGEVTNLPLLEAMGKTRKRIYLSSGMSSWNELDTAVETIQHFNSDLWVMQCTSAYPTPYEQVGLNVMLEMETRYNLPVGLSDHTNTNYAAFAAVALGASVIEKHLTFSKRMYGSDAQNASEPHEFAELVQGIRAIETLLANPVDKNDLAPFQVMKETFEKSLVALMPLPKGTVITREMIGEKKPGTGISAARVDEYVGRKIRRDISANMLFVEDDFE
jgi:N,N'-diacetyllegionaminate synthase